jgi:hypothetical protein
MKKLPHLSDRDFDTTESVACYFAELGATIQAKVLRTALLDYLDEFERFGEVDPILQHAFDLLDDNETLYSPDGDYARMFDDKN